MQNDIKSIHKFLFPFYIISPNQKKEVLKKLIDNGWKEHLFNENNTSNIETKYNQYHYFYSHVRSAIFNTGSPKGRNSICREFYLTCDSGTYTITDIEKKKTALNIIENGITLHYYEEFGVAIICFHLENKEKQELKDILFINECGRRIFPPYLPLIDDTNKQGCKDKKILADDLTIKLSVPEKTNLNCSENFVKDKADFQQINYHDFFINVLKDIDIQHILDDRMFVLCFYFGGESFITELKESFKDNQFSIEKNEEKIKDWYKFCFIDNEEPGVENKALMLKQLNEITYSRWVGDSTFYGFTRYSFTCLTRKEDKRKYLKDNFENHYYRLVLLLLVTRTMIVKFSHDISSILSDQDYQSKFDEIKSLHNRFMIFNNRIWFNQITAQEQGIELFELGRKQMDLKEQKAEVQQDISNLYTHMRAETERKKTNLLQVVSVIGFLFAIVSTSSTLFKILTIDIPSSNHIIAFRFFAILPFIFSAFAFIGILIGKKLIKPLEKIKPWIVKGFVILASVWLIYAVLYFILYAVNKGLFTCLKRILGL